MIEFSINTYRSSKQIEKCMQRIVSVQTKNTVEVHPSIPSVCSQNNCILIRRNATSVVFLYRFDESGSLVAPQDRFDLLLWPFKAAKSAIKRTQHWTVANGSSLFSRRAIKKINPGIISGVMNEVRCTEEISRIRPPKKQKTWWKYSSFSCNILSEGFQWIFVENRTFEWPYGRWILPLWS